MIGALPHKVNLRQKLDKIDQIFAQATFSRAYTTKPNKELKPRVQQQQQVRVDNTFPPTRQDLKVENILPPNAQYREVETRSQPKPKNKEKLPAKDRGGNTDNIPSPVTNTGPYLVSLSDLSATIAEMKANDPAHKYRKNKTSTTTKPGQSSKPNPQEEYDTVKSLLREPKEKQQSSSSLPGIETFNNNNNDNIGQRIPDRYAAYKKNFRKRHFRDKQDIEEANVIQQLMKQDTAGSKAKKQKNSSDATSAGAEIVVKQEDLTDQLLIPNAQPQAGPSDTNIDNNIISVMQQEQEQQLLNLYHQQQPQQQLQSVTQSLMQTINSTDWNDPYTFLPRGMNNFVNYFTPEQIQILQLLNQRHVLENYQRMATSVEKNNNTPLLNIIQGNSIEDHGEFFFFFFSI